jgi:hypothetical protein
MLEILKTDGFNGFTWCDESSRVASFWFLLSSLEWNQSAEPNISLILSLFIEIIP